MNIKGDIYKDLLVVSKPQNNKGISKPQNNKAFPSTVSQKSGELLSARVCPKSDNRGSNFFTLRPKVVMFGITRTRISCPFRILRSPAPRTKTKGRDPPEGVGKSIILMIDPQNHICSDSGYFIKYFQRAFPYFQRAFPYFQRAFPKGITLRSWGRPIWQIDLDRSCRVSLEPEFHVLSKF